MGKSWNFELHDSVILDDLVETIRKVDIESNFGENSEENNGDSRESFYHLREFLYRYEQSVDRNMNVSRCFW